MRSLLLFLALSVAAAGAAAQDRRDHGQGLKPPPGFGQRDRERPDLRRSAPPDRVSRPERMRPEERDKLRRDIEDANKHMKDRRR